MKLPTDLYARYRAEARASGLTLPAVVRLALDAGLPTVEAEHLIRTRPGRSQNV